MESSVRKNTLKLCFESGAKVPSHLEVLRFITGQLHLSAADLHSVYKDENDGLFFIKFLDEDRFNDYCNHVEEIYAFKYDDGSTTPISLDMASRIFRYVRIFNLPPEIDDRLIAQVLGQFGTVRQQVRERYPAEYNLSVFSGVRGVHMEIAKEIPANIFIGHFRARIYYDGLKNRCFYCKEEGHLKANCPKLAAASASNSNGGARSYSSVAAHGRPVFAPNRNTPALVANMQVLNKGKDDKLNSTPQVTEQAEPEPQVTTEAEPGPSKPLEKTRIEQADTDESTPPMETDPKQGQKRAATSTPSSELEDSSRTDEEGVKDAEAPFRVMKNKRNKGQQKVIGTISSRTLTKKGK